jgi:hypothetical protein
MQAYTQFEWQTEAAGNGASGEKLTRVIVDLVKKLEGVQSICDLGCGNGHISLLLRTHAFEDLSFTFYGRTPWLWKNMICHARKATR